MTTIAELEQRLALLTQAFQTIEEIDKQRDAGALVASGGAGRPRAAEMAANQRRVKPLPGSGPAPLTLVAAAQAGGVLPGEAITDAATLANLMRDTLMGLQRDDPPSGPRIIASARWADRYPEERRLSQHDANANGSKIEALCAPRAIVASGGVCLPVNVDYDVPVWADAARPLRDTLPAFQADRGGVRFVSPPDLGVVSLQAAASGLGSATAVWTEATDADPAGATKPVYSVQCRSEQLVYVNAIPTRLGFGNMQGRFAPEQLTANTDVAIADAARLAELELLTLMYDSSKQVAPAQYLGATRDILASCELLCAQYRYSHRIPRTARFTAVFPEWAMDVMKADLAREIAHDNAGMVNVLAVTDAQVENWFATRNISVIWTMDGLKAGDYGTGGTSIPNQFFPVLATNNPAPVWPGQSSNTSSFVLSWLLYVEGTFQFLDGGRLDLGVVRDSTLDATNDYETFIETFEGIAFRGLEAYQVQSTIIPNGGSTGTVATSSYHE
jgi:hypothetical protein